MEFSGIVNPIKNENVFQYSHPRFVKKMTFPPQKTKGKIVTNFTGCSCPCNYSE